MTSPSRFVTLLLFVCAAAAFRAQPQAPTMPGYPALGARAVVKLVAPGAAPRRALRYTVANGAKSTMEISQSATTVVNLGGVLTSIPTTVMVVDLHVTNVAPSGDMTFGLTFTDARVVAASGDEGMAAMMAMGLAAMKGLSGTGTITSRGLTTSLKMNLDRIADPAVRASLDQASRIEHLSTPFPEAAVGVGAKWEVRQTVDTAGLTVFKKSEYEIAALDAAGVTMRVKTAQTAPPQSASMPGMPAGEKASLERLTASGSGTATVRFAVLASAATMESTTSAAMRQTVDGQMQSVSTDVKAKITMTVK